MLAGSATIASSFVRGGRPRLSQATYHPGNGACQTIKRRGRSTRGLRDLPRSARRTEGLRSRPFAGGVGDLGVGVVDDLDLGRLLREEHRGAAREGLDIGLVDADRRRGRKCLTSEIERMRTALIVEATTIVGFRASVSAMSLAGPNLRKPTATEAGSPMAYALPSRGLAMAGASPRACGDFCRWDRPPDLPTRSDFD
jgi:hypothetical protein